MKVDETLKTAAEKGRGMRALTVITHPASDLPGVCVARCLELDLVTQGRGAAAALRALAEAVEVVSSETPRPGAADDALVDFAASASSDESSFEGCVGARLVRALADRRGEAGRLAATDLPPRLRDALADAGVETVEELQRVVRLVGRLRVADLAALQAAASAMRASALPGP